MGLKSIDIVDVDVLASHHDAEMALVMAEVFASMPFLPRATIHVNNRKVLEGFYRGLGIVTETRQECDCPRRLLSIHAMGDRQHGPRRAARVARSGPDGHQQ